MTDLLQLREGGASHPFAGDGSPGLHDEPRDLRRDGRLLCASCGAAITSLADALDVDGSHRHVKTNPAGYTFEIGCFRDAPGVSTSGVPTAGHTWFSGYRWSYASCARCRIHLGWTFEGAGPSFVALVIDRLAEE